MIISLRKQLADRATTRARRPLAITSQLAPIRAVIVTIHRVLHRHGFVTPQPQKRPRSSWTRFESDLPNESWQSDMTHWQLRGSRRGNH